MRVTKLTKVSELGNNGFGVGLLSLVDFVYSLLLGYWLSWNGNKEDQKYYGEVFNGYTKAQSFIQPVMFCCRILIMTILILTSNLQNKGQCLY